MNKIELTDSSEIIRHEGELIVRNAFTRAGMGYDIVVKHDALRVVGVLPGDAAERIKAIWKEAFEVVKPSNDLPEFKLEGERVTVGGAEEPKLIDQMKRLHTITVGRFYQAVPLSATATISSTTDSKPPESPKTKKTSIELTHEEAEKAVENMKLKDKVGKVVVSLVEPLKALKTKNQRNNEAIDFLIRFSQEIQKLLPEKRKHLSKYLAVNYFYKNSKSVVSEAAISEEDLLLYIQQHEY